MAECEWAMLCDYAFQDAGRKTCLIGIFDRIFTKAVPAQHHQAAFVFKITGDPNEEVDFKIEISRPTGGLLGSVGGKLKVPPAGTVEIITNLQGLQLPDFGAYGFTLSLGGGDKPAKVVGVTVIESPAAESTAAASPESEPRMLGTLTSRPATERLRAK